MSNQIFKHSIALVIALLSASCTSVANPAISEEAGEIVADRSSLSSARFSGMWRVQWNAGTPIITAVMLDAPEGVHISLTQLSLRGAATFYAVGGDIQNGMVMLSAIHQSGHHYTNKFSVGLQAPQGADTQIAAVDATTQFALSHGSPPINVPLGTKVLRGRVISRMILPDGTSTDQAPELEDATILAYGTLQYVTTTAQ